MLGLSIFLLIITLGLSRAQSFYYELSYDVPDYSSSQAQYSIGRPKSHQRDHFDHYQNQGNHYNHKGHGGHFYHDYHHQQRTSKNYENKKYNCFGYVSDSNFEENSPASTKRYFGHTWQGEEFGRPWESTTKYPLGHPLHNHKPGHPWHNPHVSHEAKNHRGSAKYPFGHPLHNHPPGHPWHNPNIPYESPEDLEDDEEIQEKLPDPTMFPFGERVTPRPKPQHPKTTTRRPQFEEIPQKLPGYPPKKPQNPEKLAENPKKWPDRPEKLPEAAQELPESSQKLPESPQLLPEIPQKLPEGSQTTSTGQTLNGLDQTSSKRPNLVDLEHLSTTGQPWKELGDQTHLTTKKPRNTPTFQTSGSSNGAIGTQKQPSFQDILTPEDIQAVQKEIESPTLESDACIVPFEKILQLYRPGDLILQGEDLGKYPPDVLKNIICQTGSSILKGQVHFWLNSGESPIPTNGVPATSTEKEIISITPQPVSEVDNSSSKVFAFVPPKTIFSPQTTPGVETTTISSGTTSKGSQKLPEMSSFGPPSTTTIPQTTPKVETSRKPSGGSLNMGHIATQTSAPVTGVEKPTLWVSKVVPEAPKEVLYISNDPNRLQDGNSHLYLSHLVPQGSLSPSVNIIPIISTESGQKTGAPIVKINPPVIFVYHGENGEAKIDIPVIPIDQDITFQFADTLLEIVEQKLISKNPILIINHDFEGREDQRSNDIIFIQELLSKLGGKTDLPTFRLDQLPENVQIIEDKAKVGELKKLLNIPERGTANTDFKVGTRSKVNPLTPFKFQSTVLEITPDTTSTPDPTQVVDISKDIISVLNSGVLSKIQIPQGALDHPETIQKLKNDIKGKILEGLTNLQSQNQTPKSLQIQDTTITENRTPPRRSRGRKYGRTSRSRRQLMENNVPLDITSVFNIKDLLPKVKKVKDYSPEVLKSIQKEVGTYILEGVSDYVGKNQGAFMRSKIGLPNNIGKKDFQKFRDLSRKTRKIETDFKLPQEVFLKSHVSKNGRDLPLGFLQDLESISRKVRDLKEYPDIPDDIHEIIHEIFNSEKSDKTNDVTISSCDTSVRAGNQKCGADFSFIPEDNMNGGFHPEAQKNGKPYSIATLLPGENPHAYPKHILDAIQKDIGEAIIRGQQNHQKKKKRDLLIMIVFQFIQLMVVPIGEMLCP